MTLGFYYFELDVYRKRMKEMSEIINNDVVFLIFSDERLDKNVFISQNSSYEIQFSGNSAIVDLVMMSMCDYIIGPPSTFSGWASFWGKVPKYIMLDDKSKITSLDKSDFGIYMIDIMDNKVEESGRKKLTYYKNGKISTM